jgi:hypothetical protein
MSNKPETMMIDDVKYVREDSVPVFPADKGDTFPFKVGATYFVETATKYFTGKLVAVTPTELVFVNVCWIADTGRFNEFLAGKEPKESELFPTKAQVTIFRSSCILCVERGLVTKTI